MTSIHALTALENPQLHVWRDQTPDVPAQHAFDVYSSGLDADGLPRFEAALDHQIHEPAHALLHHDATWEKGVHRKDLPRGPDYAFPADLWLVEGAKRVLTATPFTVAADTVRIHLVTVDRFREGRLFAWSPHGFARYADPLPEGSGVRFDLPVDGPQRHWFLFKFVESDGTFESDEVNRLWCARDGAEVWVLPDSPSIRATCPAVGRLVVHFRQLEDSPPPVMRIWQRTFLRQADVECTPTSDGWVRFEYEVFSGFPYQFLFHHVGAPERWENEEARRNAFVAEDGIIWTRSGDDAVRPVGAEVWTLEGDHELFGEEPTPSKQVALEIAGREPATPLSSSLVLDVWVNQSHGLLHRGLQPDEAGIWTFSTFPEIVTSFAFRSGGTTEQIARHALKLPAASPAHVKRFVVLGRADPLPRPPIADLFADPPFHIARPGPWMEEGWVRFALHCPTAACVEIIGEWTDWQARPVPMRSTRDGTYWWAEVPTAEILAVTGRASVHGTLYKFLLNQTLEVQDPAADWVENSDARSASKLVDHGAYSWRSNAWRRPGWEYLTIYQLHPARFSQRAGSSGLEAVTRELTDPNGYLRRIRATALLLMPTCEFAGEVGWGYNPAFFYAVESYYGGPEALKRLVDACHERGLAVLLDVVFNHAGTSDNVLWQLARGSFFDGDTEWGAMINFDHPQVIHFFEQNLLHFMRNYRVDGFRFDFTRVIRYGHEWTAHVRQPGSGGGWEFMRRLRAAVHQEDPACLFMAENLPNDWDLTREGGVMDTQWCDEFHDRLVEAARGWNVMGRLADAMKVTHQPGARWFESTNYPESHDEVGNLPDRIACVAGLGQGYRRNKVAAAATLLGRGIPLWFMGAESGEWRQFAQKASTPLDLEHYEQDFSRARIREWWNRLCDFRRGDGRVQGPAPIRVHFAQDGMLAFSRGDHADLFVVLNFSPWYGWRSLAEMNLPEGVYAEILNSTADDFRLQVEGEDPHGNSGQLTREHGLHVPDFGVVVLERR